MNDPVQLVDDCLRLFQSGKEYKASVKLGVAIDRNLPDNPEFVDQVINLLMRDDIHKRMLDSVLMVTEPAKDIVQSRENLVKFYLNRYNNEFRGKT